MHKFFLIFFFLNSSKLLGQAFSEQVEGDNFLTSTSYLNSDINEKTSSALDYIAFYQKYISGIRGQECPMFPSCSDFGMKVFKERTFLSAILLTSDRLLRCGHDTKNYSLTSSRSGFKFLDYPFYSFPPLELFYINNSYYFAYANPNRIDSISIFINKLINYGYFQEALLEIMRIEFQSSFNIELFINKIICLKALGEYEKALFEFETKCPPDQKKNPVLLFQLAIIEYKLQNFDQAMIKDSLALIFTNDSFLTPKIITLSGLIYARKNQWGKSIKAFDALSHFDSYKQIAYRNSKILEKAMEIQKKKPIIAGVLSIVPGVGYVYTGHKQTALSAFIMNGLLAFATYSNFKNDNYGMGVLTGVFNLSFYFANIYGSIKSANRFNEQQRKNNIDKLEYNINF